MGNSDAVNFGKKRVNPAYSRIQTDLFPGGVEYPAAGAIDQTRDPEATHSNNPIACGAVGNSLHFIEQRGSAVKLEKGRLPHLVDKIEEEPKAE